MDLLERLTTVHWPTAARIFGNNHTSLIGLLVEGWIREAPATRWALDSGPAFQPGLSGGGYCDAILGEDRGAQAVSCGIIEVEGTRHEGTIRKMGSYFGSPFPDLAELQFGVFLGYAWEPKGSGATRDFPALPLDAFVRMAADVTTAYPNKEIAILVVKKQLEVIKADPRARNEYYQGRLVRVDGAPSSGGARAAAHRRLHRAVREQPDGLLRLGPHRSRSTVRNAQPPRSPPRWRGSPRQRGGLQSTTYPAGRGV